MISMIVVASLMGVIGSRWAVREGVWWIEQLIVTPLRAASLSARRCLHS
jgi:hypothetical protein